jgi:hypothetical protein
MAASVRTRVVSWKEAADKKLSVSRAALVMPRTSGCTTAGRLPASKAAWFSSVKRSTETRVPGSIEVSPPSMTTTLAEHLTDDDLKVFIGNADTLSGVDLLNLLEHVDFDFFDVGDFKERASD